MKQQISIFQESFSDEPVTKLLPLMLVYKRTSAFSYSSYLLTLGIILFRFCSSISRATKFYTVSNDIRPTSENLARFVRALVLHVTKLYKLSNKVGTKGNTNVSFSLKSYSLVICKILPFLSRSLLRMVTSRSLQNGLEIEGEG